MSITYSLYNQQQAHKAMGDLWQRIKPYIAAGHRLQVTVRKEKRSKDQNALLWKLLDLTAASVEWHGQRLSADDWKNMFTASLQKQRVVPGLDGGFVVLGMSTSNMDKGVMSDLITLIQAFLAERGIDAQ